MDRIYVYFTNNITFSFTMNGSQFGNSLYFDQARSFVKISRAAHEPVTGSCLAANEMIVNANSQRWANP